MSSTWILCEELASEGWRPAGDSLVWADGPSRRAVVVARAGNEETWRAAVQVYDERGDLLSEETTPSGPYRDAMVFARATRAAILNEPLEVTAVEQLTLPEVRT